MLGGRSAVSMAALVIWRLWKLDLRLLPRLRVLPDCLRFGWSRCRLTRSSLVFGFCWVSWCWCFGLWRLRSGCLLFFWVWYLNLVFIVTRRFYGRCFVSKRQSSKMTLAKHLRNSSQYSLAFLRAFSWSYLRFLKKICCCSISSCFATRWMAPKWSI